MSTVYDGWDTAINRRVAIKAVPLAQNSQSEGWQHLTRFRREAQAAGQLQHPNVVAIFDYGETAEYAFIIMEFVDGGTLKSALESGIRFAVADIIRLMRDILTGLQYSHRRGIVHRDIKPANIMLTSDGHAKIADFGIARVENSDITQVGMMMGTPAYMSPEQFRGETTGPSTDIYSAGVILYQLLTSERPFDGGLATIMHKALSTEPPKPSDISRTAPRSMDVIVAQAMAKQPDQRFKDAMAFAQALQDALLVRPAASATRSIAAQRVHGPLKRDAAPSYIYPVAAALLMTLATVGGVAAYWMLTPHAVPKSETAVRRQVPPLASTAAAPEPASPTQARPETQAKPETQANSPPPAAGPDFTKSAPPYRAAPVDLPFEPPATSREAPAVLPPSFAVAPLRLDPDLLAPGRLPVPQSYPTLQLPLPPSIPNAPPDAPALRGPRKDAHLPTRRTVPKQPAEKPDNGVAVQTSPPGAAPSPVAERDGAPSNPAPAPSPEVAAPPRTLGRMGMVDGVRRYIPNEP